MTRNATSNPSDTDSDRNGGNAEQAGGVPVPVAHMSEGRAGKTPVLQTPRNAGQYPREFVPYSAGSTLTQSSWIATQAANMGARGPEPTVVSPQCDVNGVNGVNRANDPFASNGFSPFVFNKPNVPQLPLKGILKHASNSKATLRPSAVDFTPTTWLNHNSVPDNDGPVIVTSDIRGQGGQQPIGAQLSTSPPSPRKLFTTDHGSNAYSRFLLVEGVTLAVKADIVAALNQDGFEEKLYDDKVPHETFLNRRGAWFMCFENLDDVQHFHDLLDSDGRVKVTQSNWDAWHHVRDNRLGHEVAPSLRPYCGQVVMTLKYEGLSHQYSHSDIKTMTALATKIAKEQGGIHHIDYIQASQHPVWEFRIEYLQIAVAEHLLRSHDSITTALREHDAEDWAVYFTEFTPPSYNHNAGQAQFSIHPARAVTPSRVSPNQGYEIFESPTGRTGTAVYQNGQRVSVRGSMAVGSTDRGNPQANIGHRHYSAPTPSRVVPAIYQAYDPQRAASWDAAALSSRISSRGQDINPDRIKLGCDVRTTIMVRGIPKEWGWEQFVGMLNEVVPGRFNYSYLRFDFARGDNVGYGFVNMEDASDVLALYDYYNRKALPGARINPKTDEPQLCEISYATQQGLDSAISKFRNSSIMQETDGMKPMLWQTESTFEDDLMKAEREGRSPSEIPPVGSMKKFPEYDNVQKFQRSCDNAREHGIYKGNQRPNGNVHKCQQSQYDRGTPAHIQETADLAYQMLGSPMYQQQMMQPPAYTYAPTVGGMSHLMARYPGQYHDYHAAGAMHNGPSLVVNGPGPQSQASILRTRTGGRLQGHQGNFGDSQHLVRPATLVPVNSTSPDDQVVEWGSSLNWARVDENGRPVPETSSTPRFYIPVNGNLAANGFATGNAPNFTGFANGNGNTANYANGHQASGHNFVFADGHHALAHHHSMANGHQASAHNGNFANGHHAAARNGGHAGHNHNGNAR